MKADAINLLKFLKKSPQFVIPIYQRNYAWTENQCRQLWADLMRAGEEEKVSAHFIGSIVYVERDLSTVASQEVLLVIDGQQRLTTSTLLIAALAQHFEDNKLEEMLSAFSHKKLRNYYLFNPDEDGERQFKLLLSEADKETLLALLKGTPQAAHASARILENHALFQELIKQNHSSLETICIGLSKLMIVEVALERKQDNPQLIFESMNSTGLALSQADLIRNYILMGLEPKLQTELYTDYWRPMEKAFGQAAYVQHFDAFMRHYLTSKTGIIPNQNKVYDAFKHFAISLPDDIRTLVADIYAYASYYCAMALLAEPDAILKQSFHDLRELKVDVAYPFLLDAYHDYQHGVLEKADMLEIVRMVESYVFRRVICGVPTNSMNKTFAALSRSLKKDRYLESVRAAFLLLPSYRRFPDDAEFLRKIQERDLYNFRSRSYWLRRLENHGRKERVAVEEYTIEHILPQNETLSPEWQQELGQNWQSVQNTWLHTLGNLTLTAYNSEFSDHAFAFKRDQITDKAGNPIGLAHSPLRLNAGIGAVKTWNETAIKARAEKLALQASQVWAMPQLEQSVVNTYNSRPAAGQYEIADHPHLLGSMQNLFEALRVAILALDPCVSEEFLKLYVAYKAETNFVDVIPQAKRLLLVLNLGINDIEDPKGICRDISGIGRWGNGDVEVGLASMEELAYVMGLVRQSFERQMGNSQDA